MDERLEKALAFSNFRATIENRRTAIRRRFETMLIVHHDNGMFRADTTTISFIDTLIQEGHLDATLIDEKYNPIDVTDLAELKSKLVNAYFAATNEYSSELKSLAKARDVKKAMDW
jgi:hypothetical protein